MHSRTISLALSDLQRHVNFAFPPPHTHISISIYMNIKSVAVACLNPPAFPCCKTNKLEDDAQLSLEIKFGAKWASEFSWPNYALQSVLLARIISCVIKTLYYKAPCNYITIYASLFLCHAIINAFLEQIIVFNSAMPPYLHTDYG